MWRFRTLIGTRWDPTLVFLSSCCLTSFLVFVTYQTFNDLGRNSSKKDRRVAILLEKSILLNVAEDVLHRYEGLAGVSCSFFDPPLDHLGQMIFSMTSTYDTFLINGDQVADPSIENIIRLNTNITILTQFGEVDGGNVFNVIDAKCLAILQELAFRQVHLLLIVVSDKAQRFNHESLRFLQLKQSFTVPTPTLLTRTLNLQSGDEGFSETQKELVKFFVHEGYLFPAVQRALLFFGDNEDFLEILRSLIGAVPLQALHFPWFTFSTPSIQEETINRYMDDPGLAKALRTVGWYHPAIVDPTCESSFEPCNLRRILEELDSGGLSKLADKFMMAMFYLAAELVLPDGTIPPFQILQESSSFVLEKLFVVEICKDLSTSQITDVTIRLSNSRWFVPIARTTVDEVTQNIEACSNIRNLDVNFTDFYSGISRKVAWSPRSSNDNNWMPQLVVIPRLYSFTAELHCGQSDQLVFEIACPAIDLDIEGDSRCVTSKMSSTGSHRYRRSVSVMKLDDSENQMDSKGNATNDIAKIKEQANQSTVIPKEVIDDSLQRKTTTNDVNPFKILTGVLKFLNGLSDDYPPRFKRFFSYSVPCVFQGLGCTLCYLFITNLDVFFTSFGCSGPCSVVLIATCVGNLQRSIGDSMKQESLICTELYSQGLLNTSTYLMEANLAPRFHPDVIKGYSIIANPVAEIMKKSPSVTRTMDLLVSPIVTLLREKDRPWYLQLAIRLLQFFGSYC